MRCVFSQIKQSKVYRYFVKLNNYLKKHSFPLNILISYMHVLHSSFLNDIVKFLLSRGIEYVLTELKIKIQLRCFLDNRDLVEVTVTTHPQNSSFTTLIQAITVLKSLLLTEPVTYEKGVTTLLHLPLVHQWQCVGVQGL